MNSFFDGINAAPPDPIFGLTAAFKEDSNEKKQNLGVGVYQNEEGKTVEMKVVQKALAELYTEDFPTSYLPMSGFDSYNQLAKDLVFSGTAALDEQRIATAQTLGGTGALRIGAEFLAQFVSAKEVRVSDPTWGNHKAIFKAAGYTLKSYSYYDEAIGGANFEKMLASLDDCSPGTVILLHTCCHNPTGADLDPEHWRELAVFCEKKQLIPFFDFAYQGFQNDIDSDRCGILEFLKQGHEILVAQSFSKSLSLYNRRTGHLSLVCSNQKKASDVLSQMKTVIRRNYSNPPSLGARVVARVLADPVLRAEWVAELNSMKLRINSMREQLVSKLEAQDVPLNFEFLLRQNGMFSYTGLSKDVVRELREKYAIYLLDSGRICVAALNKGNLDYVAESIATVVKGQ